MNAKPGTTELELRADPAILWQEVGRALMQIQLAEECLAHYAVATAIVKGRRKAGAQSVRAKLARKPAGFILNELRKEGALIAETEATLVAFVDERNWLAHRLRKENGADINDSAKWLKLLARIGALREQSHSIAVAITEWLEQLALQRGASPAQIERDTERIYRQTGGAGPIIWE